MTLRDRIGYDAGVTRLEDALQAAADHHLPYVDFNADTGPNRLDCWPESRVESVRATCLEQQTAITVHTNSAVNVAEFSPFVDQAVDQYLRGNIDLAQSLGCHGVVVHGGLHFSTMVEQRKSASLERLKRVVAYAEDRSVTLLFENLNFEPDDAEVHYMGHTVDECRYYFDAISSDRFQWAFTINHANLVPEGVDGFLDAFGVGRIGEVRLADNLGDKEVHLSPGQGNIDFATAFRRLEASGYTGFYCMNFGTLEDMVASRDFFAGLGD